jgi:CheY-like chemotaxis protein
MDKKRIILIEDNNIISMDLKLLLESGGNKVVSIIESGEEAVTEVIKEKPDLVLMDIKLSKKMDGIEAAEKIHSVIDIPIIYISAYTDETTQKRAQSTNPIDFIEKPYNHFDLNSRIESALSDHRKRKLTNLN